MQKKIQPTKQAQLSFQGGQTKPNVRQESKSGIQFAQIEDHMSQASRSFRSKDVLLENTCIPLDQNLKEKHYKFSISSPTGVLNKVASTEIYFPYKPYDVQKAYMEKVLNCLERRENGLLESPTGTGKTLSLLCSTLAWLQKRREASQNGPKDASIPNRIIYCSRTHSQIQQAVKELKRTVYQPRILVQGSREQYCIKKEFEQLKGGILNSACQKALNPSNMQSHCKYYQNGMEDSSRDPFKLRMPDIEDLRTDGYNNRYCPYYQVQRTNNGVDVLFLPYNYLLDRSVRSQTEIITKNAVIIFDEAHNIHKTAEEGFSISLQYSTLCAAEKDLIQLSKYIARGFASSSGVNNDNETGTPIKALSEKDRKNFNSCELDCQALLKPILELKSFFKSKSTSSHSWGNTTTKEIKEGQTIFEWIEIHTRSEPDNSLEHDINQFRKALEKERKKQSATSIQGAIASATFEQGINLNNISAYISKAGLAVKDLINGSSHYGLDVWMKFLDGLRELWLGHAAFKMNTTSSVFRPGIGNSISMECGSSEKPNDIMKDFKVYFDLDDKDNPSLNVACLNPSINFSKIMAEDPHCLIFTSGTLKPFDFWKSELRIPFQVVLENNHVIDPKKSLFAAVVKYRPIAYEDESRFRRDPTFNFSYEKRRDQDMLVDLGIALTQLLLVIPNGVLVVFPSNQLMDSCRAQWMTTTGGSGESRIMSQLTDIKNIYWEQKSSSETSAAINDYKIKSKSDRGAVFFCVARGKITEGIDFSDEYARAVILVGLPYPPIMNVKIQVKKDYLNELKEQKIERLSGDKWYNQEAIRAMNQSIGRVIRHIDDWGCILFMDERFNQPEILNNMPQWCPTTPSHSFDATLVQTSEFFMNKKKESDKKNEEQKKLLAEKRRQEELKQKMSQTISNSSNSELEPKKRVFDFASQKNLMRPNASISSLLPSKPKRFFKSMVLLREEDSQCSNGSQNSEIIPEDIPLPRSQSFSEDTKQPINSKRILDNHSESEKLLDFNKVMRLSSEQNSIQSRLSQNSFSTNLGKLPTSFSKQSKY